MTDEQFLLASAYLDGELTPAELTRAEADPAVMSAVAELRGLTSRLADVPPPAESTRTRAIAAALQAFQPTHAGAAAPNRRTGPAPRSGWSRRYLAVAAVVVSLGIVGTVVALALGGGNGDDQVADSAIATVASKQTAPSLPSLALDQTAGATASELAPATDAGAGAAAPDVDSTDDTFSAEAARPMIPLVTDPNQVLTTPEELTGRGRYLLELSASGTFESTPEDSCTFTQALAAPLPEGELAPGVADHPDLVAVLERSTYSYDGTTRPVLLAVDPDTGQTFALEPDTCVVLVIGGY